MAAFAMFASDLDAVTRRQLTRGERLMELLKQPQNSPYAVEDQVVSIWAGTKGYLDDLEVADVLPFEKRLLEHMRSNTSILTTIAETGLLTDETEAELKTAVEEFHAQWISARGAMDLDDAEVEAEHSREEITVRRGGKA